MAHTPKLITQSNASWGLMRLTSDGPLASSMPGYTYDGNACGQGVTIYVLDEVIRASHVEFNKLSRVFYDANGHPTLQREDPTRRIGDSSTENPDDHGTFVAGVAAGCAYGVAKSATVVSLYAQTIDDLEEVKNRILADRALPAVLNISSNYDTEGGEGNQKMVELIKAGIHVVVAAGNYNKYVVANWKLDEIPVEDQHHVQSIIWVGASTSEDKRWVYSNYGPIIDLFAPGLTIKSATHEGGSDTSATTESGTSFAAPHVAGIIACLLSHPLYKDLDPRRMKDKILAMAWPDAVKDLDPTTTTKLASCRLERWDKE